MKNFLNKKEYKIKRWIVLIFIVLFIMCGLCGCFVLYKYTKLHSYFDNKVNNLNDNIRELEEINKENKVIKKSFSNPYSHVTLNEEYGFHQGTHPKVLYFDEGFNGYKYWMAYTPYFKAQDEYENPTIVVSNDGNIWNPVDGLKNPIDVPSNYKVRVNYNSDTHLVYNSDTKELECFWRYYSDDDNKIIIYRKTTKDGVNWGNREEVLVTKKSERDLLSPAIVYSDGKYMMWYVSNKLLFEYTESEDLKTWSDPVVMNVKFNDEHLNMWHLDVIKDEDDYKCVMSAFYEGHNHVRMNLYYSTSKDNRNWEDFKVILTPTIATTRWDNMGIYRSSITKVNDKYKLFYSGISSNEDRNIGVIEIDSFDDLIIN